MGVVVVVGTGVVVVIVVLVVLVVLVVEVVVVEVVEVVLLVDVLLVEVVLVVVTAKAWSNCASQAASDPQQQIRLPPVPELVASQVESSS